MPRYVSKILNIEFRIKKEKTSRQLCFKKIWIMPPKIKKSGAINIAYSTLPRPQSGQLGVFGSTSDKIKILAATNAGK